MDGRNLYHVWLQTQDGSEYHMDTRKSMTIGEQASVEVNPNKFVYGTVTEVEQWRSMR